MIAMYWKFGTGDAGVGVEVCEAVGEGVCVALGESVNVGRTGVEVDVCEGTRDATLGGADVAQAVIKTNRKIE